jgi:hypothetical protein
LHFALTLVVTPHVAKNERDARIFLYAAPSHRRVCRFH